MQLFETGRLVHLCEYIDNVNLESDFTAGQFFTLICSFYRDSHNCNSKLSFIHTTAHVLTIVNVDSISFYAMKVASTQKQEKVPPRDLL